MLGGLHGAGERGGYIDRAGEVEAQGLEPTTTTITTITITIIIIIIIIIIISFCISICGSGSSSSRGGRRCLE